MSIEIFRCRTVGNLPHLILNSIRCSEISLKLLFKKWLNGIYKIIDQ